MDNVINISKLSDHAGTILRTRGAKACVILVVEANGEISQGVVSDGASPHEVQDALCAGIIYNSQCADERASTTKDKA